MAETLRFLFIGDIIGEPGMALFQKWALKLKEKYKADAIIVNGENAAKNGMGITPKIIETLRESGADVITTGNHAFDSKNVYNALGERDDVIRPANYPSGCPGKGHTVFQVKNHTVAVINLLGRVFIRDLVDCPFKTAESAISYLRHKTPMIFVDFHAEVTAEKQAMGLFLDGKVSGVYGTHTHVQTSDDRVLPQGTSYITDLGCSGALNSVIGFDYEGVIKRFQIHHKFGKFSVAKKGPMVLRGVCVDLDTKTGKTVKIERIQHFDNDLADTLPTGDNK